MHPGEYKANVKRKHLVKNLIRKYSIIQHTKVELYYLLTK